MGEVRPDKEFLGLIVQKNVKPLEPYRLRDAAQNTCPLASSEHVVTAGVRTEVLAVRTEVLAVRLPWTKTVEPSVFCNRLSQRGAEAMAHALQGLEAPPEIDVGVQRQLTDDRAEVLAVLLPWV